MANDNGKVVSSIVDPVGVELVLSIVSVSVSVVCFLMQFGQILSKNSDIRKKLETLREELLRLQYLLDDLILLFERVEREANGIPLGVRKTTISETLLMLRERDYMRWRDLSEAVNKVGKQVFTLISEIRKTYYVYSIKYGGEPFDPELISSFDRLIIGLGTMTVEEFVGDLRDGISQIDKKVHELIRVA